MDDPKIRVIKMPYQQSTVAICGHRCSSCGPNAGFATSISAIWFIQNENTQKIFETHVYSHAHTHTHKEQIKLKSKAINSDYRINAYTRKIHCRKRESFLPPAHKKKYKPKRIPKKNSKWQLNVNVLRRSVSEKSDVLM